MRSLSLAFVLICAACSGTPDPCASNPSSCRDAGGGGSPSGPGSCTGVCAPHVPDDWTPTALLWVGLATVTPPQCPAAMPAPFPGFADTPPTVTCPTCACSPSSASCLLPAQLTANASACPGGSGGKQFDPPNAWDGTCNAANPVSSADSLTVAPLPSPGGSCTPVATGTMTAQGPTAALQCDGMNGLAPGTCGDQSMVCVYPKFDGFLTCIIKFDENACPAGWPTRHIVYTNDDSCACTCSDPMDDSCSSTVTVYEDGACSQPLGSAMVSSDQPQACVNVPHGSAFGSKSATPPVYNSGTCTPSTGPATQPLTFCCLL
jgi:hypothetical protein